MTSTPIEVRELREAMATIRSSWVMRAVCWLGTATVVGGAEEEGVWV